MRTKTVRKAGPKTPEGRARSSQNAVTHGLFSSQVLLQHEDPDELEALRQEAYAALKPEGLFEELYADQIVAGLWRLRRAMRVETANMDRIYADVLSSGSDQLSPQDHERRGLVALLSNRYVDNIHGYATKIHQEIQRAQQQLAYQQLSRRSGQPIPFGSLRISFSTGRSRGRPAAGTEK